MSMHSWTITGYGINTEDLNPSIESQIAFIKKFLPDIYEEMQEDGKENNINTSNEEEYLDFCDSWIDNYENTNCERGFNTLFAEAIQENEEGFYPEYILFENCGAILYEDRMPWEMSERVKKMSAKDMADIFQKYLDFLNITASIERQSIEMWG